MVEDAGRIWIVWAVMLPSELGEPITVISVPADRSSSVPGLGFEMETLPGRTIIFELLLRILTVTLPLDLETISPDAMPLAPAPPNLVLPCWP